MGQHADPRGDLGGHVGAVIGRHHAGCGPRGGKVDVGDGRMGIGRPDKDRMQQAGGRAVGDIAAAAFDQTAGIGAGQGAADLGHGLIPWRCCATSSTASMMA